MRGTSKRLLLSFFEALPASVLLRIRKNARELVSKKPQLLKNQTVRFILFDILKVELATAEIRIEQ
jgi:hypothetical protein